MYYYYYNTSGYSNPTLALRAKSSFYQSLNGGGDSHASSLYSIPRNPSFHLYSYLLSSRRHHSAFVRLEPSRTFLLTGWSIRRTVVGVCDRSSSSGSSRCCCCCCGCTKGDTLGSAFKKPLIKDGSCCAGTRGLRKKFDFSDGFERSGGGRRGTIAGECCGCNKGDNLGLDLETSSRNEQHDNEGSVVGRRRNVVVGKSSRGSSWSGREFDGVGVEEKEVREVWKYEDDACSGRDSRKETETKGFDRRGCGGEEVSRSSNRYSGIQYRSNLRKADREDKQQREVERSDRTESSKSSQIGSDVERVSNSQRRFEQVRANGRKVRSSTVDNSVRVASDNRIEVDQQGFDKMESNQQYETRTNISRIHARDARRATDTRSSFDIRDDNRRSDNGRRYFEKEQMKGGENRYSSVENVVQVARDNRTGVDRQEVDKMKSNRQGETQTDISRVHATDTQRASSSGSSLEIRADNSRSDNSRKYFEEEQMRDQENRYASVENVVQARENRRQSDQQEFDKMKSNRQYETQTGISRVHATDTRRANDANSSLEIRAGSKWPDIRRSYFKEEQMKESENRSSSLEYVVEMAREKRIQLDQQEFDKMELDKHYTSRSSSSRIHPSETERAYSSRGSLGMRTDGQEENLSSAVNVVHGTGERWTIGSDRVTHVHELEGIHPERLSNLQEISDTRMEDQKETSSLLVRDKEEQRSTFSGESSQSTNTQMRFGQRIDGSSISLYQVKNDAIESASRLGKSSASYVGEFVDKLRQEISTTELSETNTEAHRETSQSVSDVTARLEEGTHTEEVGRDFSSRSGIKGPSDEMWEVRGASSQEPSKIEEPMKDSSPVEVVDSAVAPGSAESAVSRRSHRSLWNYLVSIIKLGLGQSARSNTSATKSTGRSSSNESIGSEAWFSGNEADENEDEAKKKGLNRSPKGSVLTKTPAEQYEIGSSTSTGTLRIGSSSKRASLVSGAEDSEWHEDEEGKQCIISGVVYTDQAAVLTGAKSSTSMTEIGKNIEEFSRERLPVVSGTEGSETELRRRVRSPKQIGSTKGHAGQSRLSSSTSMGTMRTASSSKDDSLVSRPEDLESGEGRKQRQGTASDVVPAEQLPSGAGSPSSIEVETVQMLDSGSTELEDLSNQEKIPEVGGSEGKDGEMKRRKFQRNKQVMKEQFDEWEEAYVREREQRKADELFMREALLEAKKAADAWEVPVGAVLVQNGKVIARGCNLVEELRDSTAHAEMICIREASSVLRTWRLAETTLYVTLEPCAMCAGAILQARIDTVVWGAPNKLLGADGSWVRLFPSADGGSNAVDSSNLMAGPVHPFHPKITVRRGILATECADAMQQFFQLRRKKIKEEEQQPPPPPSCLPVSTTPTKLFTKMQDIFHMMFCL